MGPDDVGGDNVLNNIKRDVMEMFVNALTPSLNQKCYCTAPLERCKWDRPFTDWRCKSCFVRQSGRIVFQCPKDRCVFTRLSGYYYQICASCFKWTENNNFSDETDRKVDGMEKSPETLICGQINRSINMIS